MTENSSSGDFCGYVLICDPIWAKMGPEHRQRRIETSWVVVCWMKMMIRVILIHSLHGERWGGLRNRQAAFFCGYELCVTQSGQNRPRTSPNIYPTPPQVVSKATISSEQSKSGVEVVHMVMLHNCNFRKSVGKKSSSRKGSIDQTKFFLPFLAIKKCSA